MVIRVVGELKQTFTIKKMQSVHTNSAHAHLQYAIVQDNGQDPRRTMCYKRPVMSAGLLINCSESALQRERGVKNDNYPRPLSFALIYADLCINTHTDNIFHINERRLNG